MGAVTCSSLPDNRQPRILHRVRQMRKPPLASDARAASRGRRRLGSVALRARPARPFSPGPAQTAMARFSWAGRGARGGAASGGVAAGLAAARADACPTATQFRQRLLDGHQPPRLHQPHQPQFQMKPRLQTELQIPKQVERKLQIARQVFFRKPPGDLRQLLPLGRRSRHQPRQRVCRA